MLWFIVLICAILLFFALFGCALWFLIFSRFSFLSGNGMSLGENRHHVIREAYR